MIWDTFMIAGELDMLECRLTELQDVPGLVHVAVEADTDHQGHPKPYHLADNFGRFEQWADRLIAVQVTGLPDSPDAWDREHAQREMLILNENIVSTCGRNFADYYLHADPEDIILHGDIDEIPTATFARHVRPRGFVVAGMDFYCFAVDWKHPQIWPGTVAGRVKDITSFTAMRDARLTAPIIPRSGWHFTWIGGHEATLAKTSMFCHLEVMEWSGEALERDDFYLNGYHVDGARLEAVEVDRKWPRWIREGHAPAEWFRPRDIERRTLNLNVGQIVKPA